MSLKQLNYKKEGKTKNTKGQNPLNLEPSFADVGTDAGTGVTV